MSDDLVRAAREGLACDAGGFWIDPWKPVPVAVVTHAHSDHARAGSDRYLAAEPGVEILKHRLGPDARVEGVPYGERVRLGETAVSFHPAGHVLGSAQVRVERGGETWVVTGDYKRAADPTCAPFEPVPCDVLITEATFALPVYRWPEPDELADQVLEWWRASRRAGRASVLFCYALGKAQRLLAEIARRTDDGVVLHGAMNRLVELYREAGVTLPPTSLVSEHPRGASFAGELVLAPPSARGTPWMRRFAGASTAFASGWMRVRGNRRRRSMDRGFVLSDHADWPALLRTVEESGARRVLATHGFSDVLARFLREERGLDASTVETRFEADDGRGADGEPGDSRRASSS